jgi:hypothetical protein
LKFAQASTQRREREIYSTKKERKKNKKPIQDALKRLGLGKVGTLEADQ